MNEWWGYSVISFLEIVKSINENEKKVRNTFGSLQYINLVVNGSTLIDGTARIEEQQQISKTQL